jgi:hypothetical protein
MGLALIVSENASNQEPAKNKKQKYARPTQAKAMYKEVIGDDHEGGNGAKTVESPDIG